MTVPIEAKTFTFTPELLKGKEGAPNFKIRYATRRDKHTYRAELAARGLTGYSEAEIRTVILEEMRRLSSNTDEAKDRMIDTAKRLWDSQDAHDEMVEHWLKEVAELDPDTPPNHIPPPPENDFDAEERAWITGIIETVQGQSVAVGNMLKANVKRQKIVNEVSLAVVLVDAGEFNLTRDADGVIERSCLADLEEWLGDKAEELGIEPRDADAVYAQLCRAAFLAFHLPKEAEKNFASAPRPSSPENPSKQEDVVPVDSTSTESEKSNSKTTPSDPDTTSGETSANSLFDAGTSMDESTGLMEEASSTSQSN
jgi:hypothetical protein